MSAKVELSKQVVRFVRNQTPEVRRKLKEGLNLLASEKGDIQTLEGPLSSYHRLRIMGYRILFKYAGDEETRAIRCLYAEKRSLIYETFSDIVRKAITHAKG